MRPRASPGAVLRALNGRAGRRRARSWLERGCLQFPAAFQLGPVGHVVAPVRPVRDTIAGLLGRCAMPVTGVGGVFFRAKNPDALQQWYRDHLGVVLEDGAPWNQEAGPTVIMPFAEDADSIPAGRQWMINYRVTELD